MDLTLKQKESLYLQAKETYYQGNPIMSDSEFDRLEDELKNQGSSVIDIVGFSDRNLKFPHKTPMLSLAKYQTDKITGKPPTESATSWMKSKIVGKQEHFSFGCKYDGNAGNAIYKNGKLHIVLSRGNGKLGRDITSKVINQIPKTIPYTTGTVEVRAEILIPKDIFAKKYAAESKNERNFVAGILSKDNNDPEILNEIVFMAHEIKATDGKQSTYISVDELSKWGFNQKYPLVHFYYHYSEFEKAFFKMKEYREKTSPFLLDGIVIKVAEKYRNNFGENAHDPNWAIGVKFAPKDSVTTEKDIEWNFGKTGHFTPIGIFEPVDLDGSIVSRASLYNYGYVVKNQLYPGANVTIAKSGDIIPQVIKINSIGDIAKFNAPTHCPHCKSELEIINDIHLACTNPDCEGIKKYYFYQSVAVLELFGVGGSIIGQIWDSGFHNATDLLNPAKFNKQTLLAGGKFTDGRTVDKIFEEIEKINELSLQQVILMMGFKGLGHSMAIQIANKIAGVDYSFDSLTKDIVAGFEIGDTKRKLVDETVNELSKYIVITKPKSKKDITFVELTGSPKNSGCKTKDEYLELLEKYKFEHGKLLDAKYLITDDLLSKTSKMQTAKNKGIEIYTYEDFLQKFCKGVVVAAPVVATKTDNKPKTKSLF